MITLVIGLAQPSVSHAGIISAFTGKVKAIFLPDPAFEEETTPSSQTMLKPVVVESEEVTGALSDSSNSSTTNLSATTGSLRLSTEEVDFPTSDEISLYEVKKGDTLAGVAKLFGVTKNTIVWANDLKTEKITPGDTLIILPITGIKHTIKKGDTIVSVAKKYKADADEIAKFSGISKDAALVVGEIVLVPDGEIAVAAPVKPKVTTSGSKVIESYVYTATDGYFVRPILGGRRTQGVHGRNGIDLAHTLGTPVMAAAGGRVISARSSGYNGGYGNMIIITHDNGTQTVYAHLRAVYVVNGQTVTQGQTIGELGNTGKSTGPHLHFEIRGAKNPF
jgi:LysM repeat protein